jgi:hypothetical protein
MSSLAARVVAAAALGAVLSAGTARADDEEPAELGLGAGQMLAGMGAAVVPVLLTTAGSQQIAPVAVLLTPAAVGGTVCAIGSMSRYYDSGCGYAMLGAYLGAMTIIPVGIWAYHETNRSADPSPLPLLATVASWLVVQPAASVFAWQLGKRPKELPQARAPRFALSPARGLARLPGEVTAPLLSFSF